MSNQVRRRSRLRRGSKACRGCVLLGALAFVLLAADWAAAAPGDLDPGFGVGGKVRLPTGAFATGVALQDNGRIVAVGWRHNSENLPFDFVVARFRPNGRIERTFGDRGIVTTDLGSFDRAISVAIQPDGRIVVGGSAGSRFALARYLPDGTLDDSFSDDGIAITDGELGLVEVNEVAIQADGKIVAAGLGRGQTMETGDFAIARFRPDGTLDDSFSGDGFLTMDFFGGDDTVDGLAVLPDGRIVAAGTVFHPGLYFDDIAIARFNPDGSSDPGLGADGTVTFDRPGFQVARDVAVTADGRIVVAADGELALEGEGNDLLVVRYLQDGSLDGSFSDDGAVATDFGSSEFASSVVIQSNDRIIVGGEAEAGFALARYDRNGSPDRSFSDDGRVTTAFTRQRFTETPVGDIVLRPDGLLVAAGGFEADHGPDSFTLARYETGPGPSDADADGVRDRDDRCPNRAGETKSGCHRFRQALSIRYEENVGKFVVTFTSRAFACKDGRSVALFRDVPGRDDLVAKTHFTGLGKWRLELDQPAGRYYARVHRVVKPKFGICPPARAFWPST
jgi:uncharacterized delta-60 repeat protein